MDVDVRQRGADFFVAGCVGTYHFHKDTVTASRSAFIKFGFTTSIGTLSKLSLVFMAVDYIKKKSRITQADVLLLA